MGNHTKAAPKAELKTADPIHCTNCQGALNCFSALLPTQDSESKLWQCEFCLHENVLKIEEGEIPRYPATEYVIMPPTTNTPVIEPMVIFCIDISGSMCVTTEVQGKVNIHSRAVTIGIAEELRALTEGQAQWLPGQNQNVSYISRMQCVQSAVHREIENLAKKFPRHRPVLITFNHDVTVFGSGPTDTYVITGDQLWDYDLVYNTAKQLKMNIGTASAAGDAMIDKVYRLEEGGSTALGPALLYAVGLASNAPGSKVLICTDGLANVGIGNLDVTDEEIALASSIYSKIANQAKENGTTVSVISIRGDDCSMESLGTLADATNGDVDIVDPIELGVKNVDVLSIPIVATNVEVSLHLRKGLMLVNGKSSVVEKYGNATEESDLTFSYRYERSFEPPSKNLLFQVQVKYTKMNGSRCMRVLTLPQHITVDRDVAEKGLMSSVVATHALHESATLAQLGDYQQARVNLISNQRLLQRGMATKRDQLEYINFIKQAEKLDGFMREAQHIESLIGTQRAQGITKKQNRDDAAARNIVKMKNVRRNAFTAE
eukprot:TRINITY_DN2809_c0_g1_i1.p1 TRINITY_DN2809_c0_g1~~TRINITY_DN2809_c0_g1_i1.p1  ORF type:complete len:547 (-),score=106.35 TRINITY_DN2809_c0_g1_i1:69-1709(-)